MLQKSLGGVFWGLKIDWGVFFRRLNLTKGILLWDKNGRWAINNWSTDL